MLFFLNLIHYLIFFVFSSGRSHYSEHYKSYVTTNTIALPFIHIFYSLENIDSIEKTKKLCESEEINRKSSKSAPATRRFSKAVYCFNLKNLVYLIPYCLKFISTRSHMYTHYTCGRIFCNIKFLMMYHHSLGCPYNSITFH